jgi:hypothetical protein
MEAPFRPDGTPDPSQWCAEMPMGEGFQTPSNRQTLQTAAAGRCRYAAADRKIIKPRAPWNAAGEVV